MGIITGGLNLIFLYKVIKKFITPFDKTEAFKLGIIDERGKILKKKSMLKGSEEKDAYTMMDRFVWKLKRLLEKIPFGKSRLASYAAALWFLKEEHNFSKYDDDEKMLEESFMSFLETEWEQDAQFLKEQLEKDMEAKSYTEFSAKYLKEDLTEASKPAIQSFGRKLSKVKGGIDKELFQTIAQSAIEGNLPDPKLLQNMDTEPREVILSLMGKEFGSKFVEKKYGIKFTNPKNYKEEVVTIGDQLDQIVKEAKLDEAFSMRPGDKRVVDAFYDQKTIKKHGASILTTDGKTLTKTGMGGQDIAKWVNGKIKIVAVSDVKSTELILKYMKKSIPSGVFEEVEIDEKHGGFHVKKGQKWKHIKQFKNFKKYEEAEINEKEAAYPATIATLKKIVKDKQNQVVMFKSGQARVDTFTASAMVAVYDALKPATKKKFEQMIKDKAGFMKSQAFAMKMVG